MKFNDGTRKIQLVCGLYIFYDFAMDRSPWFFERLVICWPTDNGVMLTAFDKTTANC